MNSDFHEDLKKKILLRIERGERRSLILKAAGFGTLLVTSLSFVVIAYNEVIAEASRSGLWSFSSLIFSDFSSILANFSDFALSIVESFPIFSTAVLLCGVFFTVWTAARFANEIVLLRERRFSLLQ